MVAFFPTLPNTKEKIAEKAWELGVYAALFFTNVKSLTGQDKYPFVLQVHGPFPESQGVVLYIVSEPGTPSNFLCAINDSGRMNFGCSEDWKDKNKFVAYAIKTANELLKVTEAAKEIQPPSSQEKKPNNFNFISLIPASIAFLVAPFDFVRGNGVRMLEGWKFIFSAGESHVQINIEIWLVQLAIAIALGFVLARNVK